jgi:hypothetical protein
MPTILDAIGTGDVKGDDGLHSCIDKVDEVAGTLLNGTLFYPPAT